MFKSVANLVKNLIWIFVGYRQPPCIGIDISSTSIKIVELVPNSLVINKYTITLNEDNLLLDGSLDDINNIADLIHDELVKLSPNTLSLALAIPFSSVIVREISAPIGKSRQALDEFVCLRLSEDLADEEIIFDYTLSNQEDEWQSLKAVVAKKDKIEEYQIIAQLAGMQLAAVEVEPFAIIYLFEQFLLKKINSNLPVLLLELTATHLRGYIFLNHKNLIFNEISVNYYSLFNKIFQCYAKSEANYTQAKLINYIAKILDKEKIQPKELLDTLINDVVKMLQMLKVGMLVENRQNLASQMPIYLIGGNALIPGLKERISYSLQSDVFYASELLKDSNPHIPLADLLRLFPAIALASWGQQID